MTSFMEKKKNNAEDKETPVEIFTFYCCIYYFTTTLINIY